MRWAMILCYTISNINVLNLRSFISSMLFASKSFCFYKFIYLFFHDFDPCLYSCYKHSKYGVRLNVLS